VSCRPHDHRVTWIAGCLLGGLLGVAASPAAAEGPNPWAKGTQWLSVRFGYAKSAAEGAADGNLGFGFGYTRFRNTKWSYGAHAQIEILGRYGDAAQIEVPWTVEITRHYAWNTPLRPYLGLGGGMYYSKISGTGFDGASLMGGGYLAGGANAPISDHGLLGLDVRMNIVDINNQMNPVFGGEATTGKHQNSAIHWGVKLNYAWVF